MARPAHEPTKETRLLVKNLVAVGMPQEDIASKLDMSVDTLARHYRKELDEGIADANATIARTLFNQAKAGNVACMIFWLKTRAGWKETNRHELTDGEGKGLPCIEVVFKDPQ